MITKIRAFFLLDFTIFALLVLLQAIFKQIGLVEDFHSAIVLEYFILTSLLSVSELLLKKYFSRLPLALQVLLSVGSAFFIATIMGGFAFHWFRMQIKWFLLTGTITVIIVPVMYFVSEQLYAGCTAEQINRQIKRKERADDE